MPVESVIPALRGVVEKSLLTAASSGNDRLEIRAGEIGAFDRGVGLVDIGFVVLAVMEAQSLGRDCRGQRFAVIRQGHEFECHWAHPSLLGVPLPLTRWR